MKKLIISVLVLLVTAIAASAAPTVNVIPVRGPLKSSADYKTFITNVIWTVKETGTFPDRLSVLAPEDLIDGSVWWIEDVKDVDDTVALSKLSAIIASNDKGSAGTNILGESFSFGPTDIYSEGAINIRKDGTVIDSGSPSQLGARLIVAIGTAHFNATAADVHKYTDLFDPWTISFTATINGSTTTASISTTKILPKLLALKVGADFIVKAENNGDSTSRPIQKAVALGGPATDWTSAGTIKAGQERNLGPADGATLFVRYAP